MLLRIAADPTPFASRVARRLLRDRTLAARINRGRVKPTAQFAREQMQATALVWDSVPESYADSS